MEHVTAPLAAMQHAPVAVDVAHEVLEQTLPAPRHRPWWVAQSASVVTEQVTPFGLAAQHAPVERTWAWEKEANASEAAQHSAAALPLTTKRARDENTM